MALAPLVEEVEGISVILDGGGRLPWRGEVLGEGVTGQVGGDMLTQAHSEVWAVVQDGLRRKLGEERYSMWIAPLKVLSTSGEELRLGVPNRFVLDWIEKRYRRGMLEVLRQNPGEVQRLELVIDPELFRQRRQQGEQVLAEQGERAPTGVDRMERECPKPGTEDAEDDAVARAAEMSLDSFIVGRSNELTFNSARQVLETPGVRFNPFFVYGSPGVGKTHLLKGLYEAFRCRRKPARGERRGRSGGAYYRVRYLSGEAFFSQYAASVQDGTVRKFRERYRSLDVLIVDDVHLLINKRKTQVEFLHTFNSLAESGRQIILASDAPPRTMRDIDPALTGRFLSGLVTGIRKPDYETRVGIVRLHADRLGSQVRDSVLKFLAENVRGSARELIGALKQIEIHTQLRGGPLSLEDARLALAELIREQERQIDLDKVKRVVSQHFCLSPETLVSPAKQRHIVLARQVAMTLARRYTKKTLGEIGRYFGRRNHTTVRNAILRVDGLRAADNNFSVEIEQVREALEG